MSCRSISSLLMAFLTLAFASVSSAAAAKSDLATPEARHATVVLAAKLAQATKQPPVSEDLKTPFNPPGFDRPDSEEQKALAATIAAVQGNVAKIRTPREILEATAPRIQPEGTGSLRGSPILYFLKKPYRIGDKFTITDEGNAYDLTLTAIDRSTFTLRYRNEEITRPIKTGKN